MLLAAAVLSRPIVAQEYIRSRDGSWNNNPRKLGSANWNWPDNWYSDFGFRVARTLDCLNQQDHSPAGRAIEAFVTRSQTLWR